MRSARSERVGYRAALSSWFFDNRLNLSPTDRAMLFKVMEILPAVEAWRETLPPMRRLRMNHPGWVLPCHRTDLRRREHDEADPGRLVSAPDGRRYCVSDADLANRVAIA